MASNVEGKAKQASDDHGPGPTLQNFFDAADDSVTLRVLGDIGSTGEATGQDMLAADCSHIYPRLLGQSSFKPCGCQTTCWRPECCWLG